MSTLVATLKPARRHATPGYFVHDPMCSWCYAFRLAWTQIEQQLPTSIRVQYVLGGLAPDSDQPMQPETGFALANA